MKIQFNLSKRKQITVKMRGLADLNRGGGGGGNGAGGGGAMGATDCKGCLKGIWDKMPLWTKMVFVASFAIYFLSFLSDKVLYAIFCSPPLIIYNFQGKILD